MIRIQLLRTITIIIFTLILFTVMPSFAQSIEEFRNSAESWSDGKTTDLEFLDSMNSLFDEKLLVRYPVSQSTYFLPERGNLLSVTIDGKIGEVGKSASVMINVINPDSTITKTSALVLDTGSYETTLVFDNSAKIGTYKIVASFNGKDLEPSYFTIVKQTRQIPYWFKETTKWWIQKDIQDSEYLYSLQYLINHRIIIDDVKTAKSIQDSLSVSVNSQSMIRRGTTQEITVNVSNSNGPVNGAQVFMRIENYSEDILKEFKGYTDSFGVYIMSWETDKSIDDYKTFLVFVDVTDGKSVTSKVFKYTVYCLPGEANCKIRG